MKKKIIIRINRKILIKWKCKKLVLINSNHNSIKESLHQKIKIFKKTINLINKISDIHNPWNKKNLSFKNKEKFLNHNKRELIETVNLIP